MSTFDKAVFSFYAPLSKYYKSEDNVIVDNDLKPIDDLDISDSVRYTYNDLLLGMLRTSVSSEIRDTIEELYEDVENTDPDGVKLSYFKWKNCMVG